jgi:alanine dehydrogenase
MKEIDAAQVNDNLPMAKCIDLMEQMFVQEAEKLAAQPQRVLTRIDSDSMILCMPAHSEHLGRYSVKIVSEFKSNPRKFSLPIQGGVILLIDSKNSKTLALLDSQAVTEIRTAAVSGLAAKLLARPNSKCVGIIGSGAEARRHLESVIAVRPGIENARVYSLHHENAKNFADEMSNKLLIEVEAKSERKDAIKDAEVILIATNSKTPVIKWSEIPSGCHINSIGTFQRELDTETIMNSKLFVDSREGVLTEAYDFMEAIRSIKVTKEHIRADLSELVTGTKKGRENEAEVTLFKSVGFALEDVYASSFIYDRMINSSA